ncbi:peptide chain release factor 1 [Planctomycetota bacterium]
MSTKHTFIDELNSVYNRFVELRDKISDPEILKKPEYKEYLREYGTLEKLMSVFEKYRKLEKEINDDRQLLEDEQTEEELKEIAREEIDQKEEEIGALLEQIKEEIYLEEAQGDKVIFEIRAGTGGDEASLFAGDLFRMYTKYCEKRKWKCEIFDSSETNLKGFKHVLFAVKGKGAFTALQYESGGHRVQRIPVTESGGRIHTSAATVAVLPEVEDINVSLEPSDLIIETFRSSGPGGQSVNTMDSAVRITHKPTGIIAACQEGKSQHTNKDKAMRILKTRIYETIKNQQDKERGDLRRKQIGSGDRNERIRTYNFPQNRVTDHRIEFSSYSLDLFIEGDLDEMLERLKVHFKERFFEEYEHAV